MAKTQEWAFPEALQPTADETQFDLARALEGIVQRRQIPA